MLKDNFYKIINISKPDHGLDNYIIQIELNNNHPIFNGHFPDNPIVPGVCQLTIIKELASLILLKNLNITKAGNIKYLAIINPNLNKYINIKFNLKKQELLTFSYEIKGEVFFDNLIFTKFAGIILN